MPFLFLGDSLATISLAIIAKNEEDTLPKCLNSVIDIVDEIILVDTGSTDRTIEIAKEIAKDKLVLIESPWTNNFSYHRQISFDQATKDYILWADADDILINPENLKDILDNQEGFDIVNLKYDYDRDEFGNTTMLHWRDRVLKNTRLEDGTSAWKWNDPVHEYLSYALTPPPIDVKTLDSHVFHNRPEEGEGSVMRNLTILEENAIKVGLGNLDQRNLMNLGNERFLSGNFAGAIDAYDLYLQISTWDDEKIQVLVKLSEMFESAGKFDVAYKACWDAIQLNANWPEPWIQLARLELINKKFLNAIKFSEIADACVYPETVLVTNIAAKEILPKTIRYKACLLMGDIEKALPDLEACIKLRPNEETKQDYSIVKTELQRRAEIAAVIKTASYDKAFLAKLPKHLKAYSEIQDLLVPYCKEKQKAERDDPDTLFHTLGHSRVTIFAGQHVEPWSPSSITTTGIGGSETAIIRLAELLDIQGCEVTVYAEPGGDIGFCNERWTSGPLYLPARYFDPSEEVDIFISCRRAEIIDLEINAREKWLWLHDTTLGDSLTVERADRFDKFLTVSHWQAKQYSNLYEGVTAEKLFVTANGIDPLLLENAATEAGQLVKDPYKFIYSSSPDRGLEFLLELWPSIKETHPQASLDIYYGWDTLDKLVTSYPFLKLQKDRISGKVEAVKHLDVKWCGRVDQKTLYKRAFGAGVYVYSTTFNETSMITALEMLACGVTFIGSNMGALSETLQGHGILIDGSPNYPEVKQAFLEAIDKALDSSQWDTKAKIEAAEYAMSRTWQVVADSWVKEIRKLKGLV